MRKDVYTDPRVLNAPDMPPGVMAALARSMELPEPCFTANFLAAEWRSDPQRRRWGRRCSGEVQYDGGFFQQPGPAGAERPGQAGPRRQQVGPTLSHLAGGDKNKGMKIGIGVSQPTDERLRYARQLGADGVFLAADAAPGFRHRGYATADELAALRARIEEYGLELLVLRLPPQRTFATLTGGPGAEQEIEDICHTVRAARTAGVPTVFFNLTPWRSLPVAWPATPGRPRPGADDVRPGSGPGRYYRPHGRGGAVLLTHDRARARRSTARPRPRPSRPYGPISRGRAVGPRAHLYGGSSPWRRGRESTWGPTRTTPRRSPTAGSSRSSTRSPGCSA